MVKTVREGDLWSLTTEYICGSSKIMVMAGECDVHTVHPMWDGPSRAERMRFHLISAILMWIQPSPPLCYGVPKDKVDEPHFDDAEFEVS